jgi:antitoxin component YwqK of YwqJK toxin-antitoxin module
MDIEIKFWNTSIIREIYKVSSGKAIGNTCFYSKDNMKSLVGLRQTKDNKAYGAYYSYYRNSQLEMKSYFNNGEYEGYEVHMMPATKGPILVNSDRIYYLNIYKNGIQVKRNGPYRNY